MKRFPSHNGEECMCLRSDNRNSFKASRLAVSEDAFSIYSSSEKAIQSFMSKDDKMLALNRPGRVLPAFVSMGTPIHRDSHVMV